MRNDGTPNDMNFLGIKNKGYNLSEQTWYEKYCFQRKMVRYIRREPNYNNDYLLQHIYLLINYYISKAI